MQRPGRALIGQLRDQRILPPEQRRVVGHRPVEVGKLEQARHEAGRLPQRQAKTYLKGQTRLDHCVREGLLPTALARRVAGQAMPRSNQTISGPRSGSDGL